MPYIEKKLLKIKSDLRLQTIYISTGFRSFHSLHPFLADTKDISHTMSSYHSSRSVRGRLLCRATKQLEKQVQSKEIVLSFESRGIQFCRKIEG